LSPWIQIRFRIRTEVKSCIRIRHGIETNADPQHWIEGSLLKIIGDCTTSCRFMITDFGHSKIFYNNYFLIFCFSFIKEKDKKIHTKFNFETCQCHTVHYLTSMIPITPFGICSLRRAWETFRIEYTVDLRICSCELQHEPILPKMQSQYNKSRRNLIHQQQETLKSEDF
jgi:hypothetical protein